MTAIEFDVAHTEHLELFESPFEGQPAIGVALDADSEAAERIIRGLLPDRSGLGERRHYDGAGGARGGSLQESAA